MRDGRWLRRPDALCALWVGLCFALTSAVYLSWLNRLVTLLDGMAADWLSMVAGYLCQAAGVAVAALLLRRQPEQALRQGFGPTTLLFIAVSAPALLARAAAPVIGFGLLMNLLCGVIAGLYLYAVGAVVDAGRRSLAFGGGYALATVAVGLLALVGGGGLMHGRWALAAYLPLAIGAAWAAGRLRPGEPEAPSQPVETRTLALALGVVVLISAVKNLGFGFPSKDIAAGLVPELSRVPYALGLAVAGWINDRSRRNGMMCTVAALIIPFIMLGLASEPVPSTICWGLDYLFYGFFSVFRVVLFLDLAGRSHCWALAPLGLLAGRLGDAAGTGAAILLASHRTALIAVTALAFFPTVYLFYRLYQRLYEPEIVQARTEQEVFDTFCLHNDFSSREREVFRMLIAEHTNGEIAEALFITENTVKFHVRNMLQKTGCKNRGELQRKYMVALYPQLEEKTAEKA